MAESPARLGLVRAAERGAGWLAAAGADVAVAGLCAGHAVFVLIAVGGVGGGRSGPVEVAGGVPGGVLLGGG